MRRMRLAIALITAATLVALFVVARPDDDGGTAAPATRSVPTAPPTLEPIPTQPIAPPKVEVSWTIDAADDVLDRRRVPLGAEVTMTVVADTSDEIHVHGYDLVAPVTPEAPATIFLRAALAGRFEIELEESHERIAQLTVVP